MLAVVRVDVRLQTPTDMPSSESYYNKGVQSNLPIYNLLLLTNTIKTYDF